MIYFYAALSTLVSDERRQYSAWQEYQWRKSALYQVEFTATRR